MKIGRLLTLFAVIGLLVPAGAVFAAKTTYVFTDHRFTFVKRSELKKKELKGRKEMQHPFTFTEPQLRRMLSAVEVSKKVFLKKEEVQKDVFPKTTLDFLLPYFVRAFQEAQPNEEIRLGFVVHNPKFLVRDDRLTIADAWVQEGKLHLEFKKLMAKIPNNYDKLSDVSQAMNRAQGIRVSLELTPGQQYGDSTDEVLLDIPPAEAVMAQPEENEEVAPAAPPSAKKIAKKPAEDSETGARLKELKRLRKEGLITRKEYEEKRAEVLKDL